MITARAARVTLGNSNRNNAAFIPKAAAALDIASIPQMTDVERAELAEQLGYRKIGKELPNDVTLQDVIKSLPEEVFEINPLRAWGAVFTTLASVAASLYLISISPWYMLPFAWALAGTAFTGVCFMYFFLN